MTPAGTQPHPYIAALVYPNGEHRPKAKPNPVNRKFIRELPWCFSCGSFRSDHVHPLSDERHWWETWWEQPTPVQS